MAEKQPKTWSTGTLIWAFFCGAAAISILGFAQMGWTLGGTAEKIAKERAETAVVAALAPWCAASVLALPDGAARKKAFTDAQSYQWRSLFTGDAAKFATLEGQTQVDTSLSAACGERIRSVK